MKCWVYQALNNTDYKFTAASVRPIIANDQIVFAGVTAKHRNAASEAWEFIVDHLKNSVPLCKNR
jgi:molybdopterin synthase catalytic subunit